MSACQRMSRSVGVTGSSPGRSPGHHATVLAVVTKTDLVSRTQLITHLAAVADLADFAEVVPVSAVTGYQVDGWST